MTTTEPALDPCNDFYDYVCATDTRVINNLTFTGMNEELEVLVPEENSTITNNGTIVPLSQLVKLTRLMKWCTEIEVLYTGVFTRDYFGDLDSVTKMNHSERYTAVVARLDALNSTMVNIFYNALTANIEILNAIQAPVSKKNAFLHWIFGSLKNSTIDEIQKSNLSDRAKRVLKKGIQMSHSYFAFYDYNNVTVIEETKLVYETEYHRLRNSLSLEDLLNPLANKILRLGATDAAMIRISQYIEHDDRFMFQAIVANPTNDAFQYLNNNHITVITRNDPHQPEKAVADTVFVTTHEILHRIYPYGFFLIGANVSSSAMKCAQREVEQLGNSDAVKPKEGWFNKEVAHEDVVNVMAMRIVMKMAANKSVNEKQLKEALETIIGGLCKQNQRKNEPIPHHHPLEISLNNAVRQYPMFSSLYGCRAGDRMFAKPEDFCKPLGNDVNIEDYSVKNNAFSKDVGGFFKDLMNTSKSLNFSYGVL
ncbi:unnamed protein product [Caenorhabditis sp. 36 PRJEB53466]|nr:unnamed protein product [Caenorhabditis sp. 36 PRJEB53466]